MLQSCTYLIVVTGVLNDDDSCKEVSEVFGKWQLIGKLLEQSVEDIFIAHVQNRLRSYNFYTSLQGF